MKIKYKTIPSWKDRVYDIGDTLEVQYHPTKISDWKTSYPDGKQFKVTWKKTREDMKGSPLG